MVTLFPCFLRSTYVKYGSDGKASARNAGDLGSILGWGKSPGEGNGNPLQYSCLGNPMDRGSWWTMVHTVPRVKYDWATSLSLFLWTSLVAQTVKHLSTMQETWVPSLGREDPMEKEMAIHSSTIAWKIPWIEEPGGLQSMGSQRVGHDWATSLSFPFLSVK